MIEEPTKEGYEFDGWNYPLPITFPSEDKTYTAKWKTSDNKTLENFSSAGSVKPVNSEGFVEIIPPKKGIPGLPIDPITNPVVENKDHYKGIFLEGKTIKIEPYLIAETEVTYGLWRKVYNWAINHGYKFQSPGHPTGYYQLPSIANRTPLPELKKYENYPIEDLTWVDCIVWCNAYTEMKTNSDEQCVYRMSRTNNAVIKDAFKGTEATQAGPGVLEAAGAYCDMSKKGYRLPTEAEWEYAARWQKDNSNNNAVRHGNVWLTKLNSASGADKPIGYKGLNLPSGETWISLKDELNRVAVCRDWYDGKGWYGPPGFRDQETKINNAVKTKAPNDCGLYDMSGNVSEWVFEMYYYDPKKEKDYFLKKSNAGHGRNYRGGDETHVRSLTVGSRSYNESCDIPVSVGFRLCKSR